MVDLRLEVALRTEPYCWYLQWLRNGNYWFYEVIRTDTIAMDRWGVLEKAVFAFLPKLHEELNLLIQNWDREDRLVGKQ